MIGTLLTLWSIRLASVCFAIVVLENCRRGTFLFEQTARQPDARGSASRPQTGIPAWPRLIWSIGCVLALLHLVFAFTFYHHWSHAEAVADTAAKTDALLGISFGGGVWFNYLFFAVWLADMIYWWVSPQGYAIRSNAIGRLNYLYLGFIMFNGVVVFGTGITRMVGIVFCLLLIVVCFWPHRKSTLRQ